MAKSYGENVQAGKKQTEVNSAAEKVSRQGSGQNFVKQVNGTAETLIWDAADSEVQMGSGEVKTSAKELQLNGGEVPINGDEVKMDDVVTMVNGHVNTPLNAEENTNSGVVVPSMCVTDETGLPILKPQATSTPLKVEGHYNSQDESRAVAENVSEGSHMEKPESEAVASRSVEQKDAEPFPKALAGAALSPQEALQSLWPISPPDLEEGYSQPPRQPQSSFTVQLENQLNAVAAKKSQPQKGGAMEEKHHHYNTYSSGMHRGSDVVGALGQPFDVELHANPDTTRTRYYEPLKDTWPRRKTAGVETPYDDSGIGCSPAVIHSSRKSTPGMVKSSRSLDFADGGARSGSTSRPTSYRGKKRFLFNLAVGRR